MSDEAWQVPVTRGAIRLRDGRLIGARTEHSGSAASVLASESRDSGKTWTPLSTVTRADVPDLGDGGFLESKRHGLLYVCRKNRPPKEFAIEAFRSADGGKSWTPHSTVTSHALTEAGGPSRGLWAPTLAETPRGRLLCIYDDENFPLLQGFRGHQWLIARFWNMKNKTWSEPVVVSRAHDPKKLSRDGMASVATVGKRLIVALESVAVNPPHENLARFVTSDDDGQTWSWQKEERQTLYAPPKAHFMALAPFLIARTDKTLASVFCTDEDRETPDRSGTPAPRLNMDVKQVVSKDGGKTWSAPQTIYAGAHRNYLPGLVALPRGKSLALWLDFAQDKLLARNPTSPAL